MHVVDMIYHWARTVPHRPAIIQSEMVTTYQGLADAVEAIGERIERLNLKAAEPVAACIANPSFMLATIFALLRTGYSAAPISERLYPYLAGAGIRNLIYDTQGQVTSRGRNIRFDMSWLPVPKTATSGRSFRHRPIGDVSTMSFTSGTTGLPKLNILSKAAFEQRFYCPLTNCANGDHQKALIVPGIASGFGFNRACEMLFAGKAACFAPAYDAGLALIELFDIDAIVASPAQALGLAEVQETRTHYALSSLKTLRIGGAVISREMGRKLRSQLCREIILSYASTEAGTAACAPYDVIENIPNAVGFVVPDVELEIVDESDVPMPAGSEGIVRLRTPQLRLNGRLGTSADRSESGSWFYPGDIGTLDENRMLCITGRTSDVINSGGVKVSGNKIEELLRGVPEIIDAAACGVTGASGMEEIWIALVTKGPVDHDEVRSLLKDNKEVGLAPREVFNLEEIPRGDLGKVQKYRLKERLLALKRGE
jgi:acyl-CoA synthetase (AMP-forming)/AMP-acid ligase II